MIIEILLVIVVVLLYMIFLILRILRSKKVEPEDIEAAVSDTDKIGFTPEKIGVPHPFWERKNIK
jgi:preprotein translocase subunit YajC